MEQKNIILTLSTILIVGVFASYGVFAKRWVDWSTTTLVDLDKRTAIMEVEAKHTNQMVVQNYQMLRELMSRVQRTNYGDGKGTNGEASNNWQETKKY
tara:strand:+ start:102 stop:395 length:294 start_codon:yes stop_codon:yes gene_type:complete